ncbi:MAG TPA: DNA-processing protein DprA [Nannocystis exedens]|nr:DNA-processing protein DprA [Nannocystis exedens]
MQPINMDQSSATPLGMLTLLGFRWVGAFGLARLTNAFRTLAEVRDAPPELLRGLIGTRATPAFASEERWSAAQSRALSILERAESIGADVFSWHDERYPALLKQIPDPPPLLYVRGTLPETPRVVACVGTRQPSEFGVRAASTISGFLGEKGWSIVSGLATGVDTLCHRAALKASAHTVAVLAGGLDNIHPRSNQDLAARIIAQGGALISEHPVGVPPRPSTLVRRDRLQSGLSIGTIAMQTDIIGGTMHTVRSTLLQGRLLFAPRPSGRHAREPKSRGILALTTSMGPELAQLLNAKAKYAEILKGRFADRPPALPIVDTSSLDDLERLLREASERTDQEGPRSSETLPLRWGTAQ